MTTDLPDPHVHAAVPQAPAVPGRTTVVVPAEGGATTWTLWTLTAGLACCAVEVSAALAAQPDLEALGVEPFAPGPAEADVLLVAGTVTDASAPLVRSLHDTMPEPKYVIAYGACTASGGPYWDSYCVTKGIDQLVPVDLVVPGCPPRPEALLDALRTLSEHVRSQPREAS